MELHDVFILLNGYRVKEEKHYTEQLSQTRLLAYYTVLQYHDSKKNGNLELQDIFLLPGERRSRGKTAGQHSTGNKGFKQGKGKFLQKDQAKKYSDLMKSLNIKVGKA